jgi:hypothetical protein
MPSFFKESSHVEPENLFRTIAASAGFVGSAYDFCDFIGKTSDESHSKAAAGTNVFFPHCVPVRPGVHYSNSICFIILVSVFTFTAAANHRLP